MTPPAVSGDAVIDPTGHYRYRLRCYLPAMLDQQPKTVLFLMLNPSTATATTEDPTVRRCITFTHALGGTTLDVANLFAYRATDPHELFTADTSGLDVVGPDNDKHVVDAAHSADVVIAAWGAHPVRARAAAVVDLLAGIDLHCLGTTKDGSPRHPLYVPRTQHLERWTRQP